MGAATAHRAELNVVSAGMGLIRQGTPIPPYSLTIARGAPDCILDRNARKVPFSESQWWQALGARVRAAQSFHQLMRQRPSALAIIALTGPYLRMIGHELAALNSRMLERLRIVGPRHAEALPASLKPFLMPYDSRLDDPVTGLSGTDFDFPARALAHFVSMIHGDRVVQGATHHARRVLQSLAPLRASPHIVGRRLTDDTLIHTIRSLKRDGLCQSSALHHLRRGMGLACEAKRFATAWKAN
jgi:hypothetical protein